MTSDVPGQRGTPAEPAPGSAAAATEPAQPTQWPSARPAPPRTTQPRTTQPRTTQPRPTQPSPAVPRSAQPAAFAPSSPASRGAAPLPANQQAPASWSWQGITVSASDVSAMFRASMPGQSAQVDRELSRPPTRSRWVRRHRTRSRRPRRWHRSTRAAGRPGTPRGIRPRSAVGRPNRCDRRSARRAPGP